MSNFLRFTPRVVAAALALAAGWHLAAMAIPSFAVIAYPTTYPVWRHIAFVFINLSFAGLFLRRPHWLLWPCSILAIQVLQSHGTAIWKLWRQQNRIDWISVFAVFITFLGLAITIHDWRCGHRRYAVIPETARNKAS